jgi:hypothetical protein
LKADPNIGKNPMFLNAAGVWSCKIQRISRLTLRKHNTWKIEK